MLPNSELNAKVNAFEIVFNILDYLYVDSQYEKDNESMLFRSFYKLSNLKLSIIAEDFILATVFII